MHRFPHVRLLLCASVSGALLLSACSGAGTPSATGPSQLHARNMALSPGDDLLLGLAPSSSEFHVRADFTPQTARIEMCRLTAIDAAPSSEEACLRDLAWGVRTPVTGRGTSGLRFRSMDRAVTLDLVIEYFEQTREVRIQLPRVPPAPSATSCLDNACNPFFELTPTHSGDLFASASFAGGDGELAVLSGRILGRSETATGVPYRTAARAEGESPLDVSAGLSSGDEYAVVIRQKPGPAAKGLEMIDIKVNWP